MNPDHHQYVHGHSDRESERLRYQASKLAELLHHDTRYPPGSRVLEAACGVGAQTVILATNSPGAEFVSVDISPESLTTAKDRVLRQGILNVAFRRADMYDLPFGPETFDHVFVCFLLEHLPDPLLALNNLKGILRANGTLTVIEGDHGSTYFYPDSEAAHQAIQSQVELQRRAGGNAMVGRELYPLLRSAGYGAIRVSPRMVYVDSSKPELVEGFTKKTFTAMIEGVRESAIRAGISEPDVFENGIRDLYRTMEPDGVFCYTFFKAVGNK